MPIIWENSNVDQLSTLHGRKTQVQKAVGEIRDAIEPLIGPDAAKILVAIAADVWSGVEKRNDLRDVKEASSALGKTLESLEAVASPIDG